MAGISKYILVHRRAAYNSVVVIIYKVLVLCCESTHTVPYKNRKKKKKNVTKTKEKASTPGFEPSTSFSKGLQSILHLNHPFPYENISDWYLSIRTNTHVGNFDENTKTAPFRGRLREHGRGRPRQSRARRALWSTSSKHHTEWWTSSWVSAVTAQTLV